MAREFVSPDFINDNNPEDIHERMMANLPADIDDMPGGFPWDFTYPTAVQKSELIQYHLVKTLMLMYPQYAWGEWLDLHAAQAGVQRREAGYAHAFIKVSGSEGTVVTEGSIFCTLETEFNESIEFATDYEVTIGEEEEETIPVTAVVSGSGSNVNANTVTLMSKTIKGITAVTNETNITGGTDEENDESLLERIEQANIDNSNSFIGNDSDYIRWAKEVVGVGSAHVIPEWDGPSTVKLVIMDSNGLPANQAIIDAVHNHIMSPEDRLLRKAPIGAHLAVISAGLIDIDYSANIVLSSGYDLESIIEQFKIKVQKYYITAKENGLVKYNKLHAILAEIDGVNDFSDFKMNQAVANIVVEEDQYPSTHDVEFELD